MVHGVGDKIDCTVGELRDHLKVELSRKDISRSHVPISALWLRNIGGKAQILAEVTGKRGRKWYLILEEPLTSAFSHIAEVGGILDSPEDPLTKAAEGMEK